MSCLEVLTVLLFTSGTDEFWWMEDRVLYLKQEWLDWFPPALYPSKQRRTRTGNLQPFPMGSSERSLGLEQLSARDHLFPGSRKLDVLSAEESSLHSCSGDTTSVGRQYPLGMLANIACKRVSTLHEY